MALSMVKELEEKTLELYAALIILCVAYIIEDTQNSVAEPDPVGSEPYLLDPDPDV
jgi:hypothetical protein